MKVSKSAMRRGWGQSAHGTNFGFGKLRWIKAMLTGKRVLICANHNEIENPPIPFIYNRTGEPMRGFHGFWSDKAGSLIWNTAVTQEYVCDHPDCIAYAKKTNDAHDEYFSDISNRTGNE